VAALLSRRPRHRRAGRRVDDALGPCPSGCTAGSYWKNNHLRPLDR